MQSDEEQRYRSLAVDFCDIAVGGTEGRLRTDPVVQAITEGHGGSSCGFLLHWLAEMLGVREPWVNRNSVSRYRQGENLSLLFGATWGAPGPKCAKRVESGQLFRHGDFIIMEDPAKAHDDHVCVVAKDFDGETLLSYDGGQRGAGGKSEDFRFCERAMKLEPNGKWETLPDSAAGKQIWAWISLPRLIEEARANGKLVEPREPAEWLRSVSV